MNTLIENDAEKCAVMNYVMLCHINFEILLLNFSITHTYTYLTEHLANS